MLLNESPDRPPVSTREAEFYVSSAAATIFGPGKKGLWAMLSAYYDESGTHDGSPVCVMAGLIASPLRWEQFTAEWLQVLRREGLESFHMVDCAHLLQDFSEEKGWSHDRTDRLIRQLVPIIKRAVQYRTWTAIYMPDYRYIVPRDEQEELPYSLAAMGCLSRQRLLDTDDTLRIPCVFDQGHEGELLYQAVRPYAADAELRLVYKVGMLSHGVRKDCPPLQAADLYAYEVGKYFADQARRTGRRMRESFRQLLEIPEAGGGGYLLSGAKLQYLLTTFLKADRRAKDPIAIPIDRLTPENPVRLVLPDTPKKGGRSEPGPPEG